MSVLAPGLGCSSDPKPSCSAEMLSRRGPPPVLPAWPPLFAENPSSSTTVSGSPSAGLQADSPGLARLHHPDCFSLSTHTCPARPPREALHGPSRSQRSSRTTCSVHLASSERGPQTLLSGLLQQQPPAAPSRCS